MIVHGGILRGGVYKDQAFAAPSLTIGEGIVLGEGVRLDPYVPPVITTGLVVSLDANEFGASPTPGTVWVNQVDGPLFTLPNGAVYSPDVGGNLSFIQSAQQSVHGDSVGSVLNTFTAETWVYFNSIPTVGGQATCTITEVYSSTPINYTIGGGMLNDATLWQGGFFNGAWQLAGSLRPSLNTWYCLSVTFDGTDINFYVNGELNGTATASGSPGSSGLGIHIGERWDAPFYPDSFLDGSVPVVRLYNIALSSAQIEQNFNAQKRRFGL